MKRLAPNSRRSVLGFTLIEVMIVVAIIAILSMIALPSYQEHVRRSKRSEAEGILMEAAQYMQRYYSANDRYTAVSGTTTEETEQTVTSGGQTTSMLPQNLRDAPKGAVNGGNYVISVEARDKPPTYTLKATRAGSMAGDKCGTLTLNSQGAKEVGTDATSKAVDCWK